MLDASALLEAQLMQPLGILGGVYRAKIPAFRSGRNFHCLCHQEFRFVLRAGDSSKTFTDIDEVCYPVVLKLMQAEFGSL